MKSEFFDKAVAAMREAVQSDTCRSASPQLQDLIKEETHD